MNVANGRTEIAFDDHNGEIVQLRDRRTGRVHVDGRGDGRDDARLWRVIVPATRWSSRYADSHESAPPLIDADGDRIAIRWSNLRACGDSTGLSVEVRARPSELPDEVRLRLVVRNDGRENATDIWFPCLGGWTGLGGKGKDMMILGSQGHFDPHSFPLNRGTTYARWHQRMSVVYPLGMFLPWVDLSGPDGGLSYIVYMERPQNGCFNFENLAGYGTGIRLMMGWTFPTVIRPGESWTSPEVGIALHSGDWHETADRYRAWTMAWFRPPPGKRELRESIGFQNVFLRGFDGTPFRSLDSIPAVAADGRKYGVNQLSIWDYMTLGNYCKQTDLDVLDYTTEEREVLRKGLRQAWAEGTNVSALINLRHSSQSSSRHRLTSGEELVRCYDGSSATACWSASHNHPSMWTPYIGPQVHWLSALSSSYRERVLRWTEEYADLGYVSMFFDQPFAQAPDYGHLAEGKRPEDTYAALIDLIGEVRRILHERNPDAFMIGEFCEVFAAQHIDQWMSWYTDLSQAVRAAYSIPQTIHSWVVDSNPAQASHAFALGMQLCLCTHGNEGTLADEPAFGEHVLALSRLRRRCAERTVHARFNHTRGIEVGGGSSVVAYSFDGAQGPAVILAAPGCKGDADVRLDRAAFRRAAGASCGRLLRLSGAEQEAPGDRVRVTLQENEVAVWLP